MSIKNLTLENINQDLTINYENKINYGEIFTPFSFIEKMFNLIPEYYFNNFNLKWLDPGSGTGYFSIYLYFKLLKNLNNSFDTLENCKDHIIKNMIYIIEINPENIVKLKLIFGEEANIFQYDYLNVKDLSLPKFDFIIGNPPFNSNGLKKTPTNCQLKKTNDGSTIWIDFVKISIYNLNKPGFLLFITPSIWLKPDKAGMYKYLTQFKIHKLHALNNTEINSIFNGHAQTPCTYFLLENQNSNNKIDIYDFKLKKYINYTLNFNGPIPVFGVSIINKISKFLDNSNKLQVIKTNLPSNKTKIYNNYSKNLFKNIKTCKLNLLEPELEINYSTKPCPYYGIIKLVMAHGMYGFPYLDLKGEYGISNRDKYIIINKNQQELINLFKFFSTKTALYLFECTRYRMKYLEKYIFELLPDINKLNNFPIDINDESIALFFGFDDEERSAINNLHKKKYKFFELKISN